MISVSLDSTDRSKEVSDKNWPTLNILDADRRFFSKHYSTCFKENAFILKIMEKLAKKKKK